MTVREAVTVTSRTGTWPATRHGRVAAYDYDVEAGRQRAYLLLDEHIQLQQPLRWDSFQPGWWYVDLIEIIEDRDLVTVHDWWIDLVVPPSGPYRTVDLDEYGAAIVAGALTPAQAAVGLERMQAFMDRHLHRPEDPAKPWRDFPPASLAPLMAVP
jgi:hypothetical protein